MDSFDELSQESIKNYINSIVDNYYINHSQTENDSKLLYDYAIERIRSDMDNKSKENIPTIVLYDGDKKKSKSKIALDSG